MNRIINPNAPPRSPLQDVLETMRMIAAYRQQYLNLRAMLQNDGVQKPLTATQIDRIHAAMQAVAENLLEFIIEGKVNHDSNTSDSKRIVTSPQASTQDNAPQPFIGIDAGSIKDA